MIDVLLNFASLISPTMLGGASRYAAVNQHFTSVSLSSPSTIIVLVFFIVVIASFIIFLYVNAVGSRKARTTLKNNARKNSQIARKKYKYNK